MENVATVERLDELFASFTLVAGDEVWLVGGHCGLQVRFFLDTYPGIHFCVFEPQSQYVEFLRNKFRADLVQVFPYALGDKTGNFIAGLEDADCTFYWKHLVDAGLMSEPDTLLPMKDIAGEVSLVLNPPKFLMMNCEGSESEIISRLNEVGLIGSIPCILTQFHSRVLGLDGCQKAFDLLSQTHEIKWRYNDWAWVFATAC